MQKIILGVFVHRKSFPRKDIKNIIEITSSSEVFVYKLDFDSYLLTFNIEKSAIPEKFRDLQKVFNNCIRLNRKTKNNVLYTINSIKEFEKNENFDLRKMKNCCLVLDKEKGPTILNLRLIEIFKL